MAETCVRSVKKALDALDFVVLTAAHNGGAGLTDIAGHLGEKLPTVRNILKTMELCGYLSRAGKAYIPGRKCADLLRGAAAEQLRTYLEQRMSRAAEEIGESFVLTALLNSRREVLSRCQGGGAVVVNLHATDSQPTYALVTTRAMLSRADPETLARFLAVNGPPEADWPEVAEKGLDTAIETLRRQGHAQHVTGSFHAYAVPVTLRDGTVFGALGVFAPTFRTTPERERLILETLHAMAADAARRF